MADSFEEKLDALLRRDSRYEREAYFFIFEALDHTIRKIGEKRHVTGRELLEGIREVAVNKFGPLARCVFENWGVYKTDDFGEIVFNMVENELLAKTEEDTREDFADVFDFKKEFDGLKINPEICKGG